MHKKAVMAHFFYMKETVALIFLDVGVSSDDSSSVFLFIFLRLCDSMVVVLFGPFLLAVLLSKRLKDLLYESLTPDVAPLI